MSLKEKFRKLRASDGDGKIDWEKNKKAWIESVNCLYKTMHDGWLSELEDENLLSIEYAPISITEEYIGTYVIDKMEISYPKGCIVLEPVGRNIIGGEGRIDFYFQGEISKGVMLILFHKDSEDEWFMVSKQDKHDRYLLTRSTFEKAIDQWITQ